MNTQAGRLAGEETLNEGGAKGGPIGKALVSVGSIVGALAASSCCILPLALFSLGAIVSFDDDIANLGLLTAATARVGFPSQVIE